MSYPNSRPGNGFPVPSVRVFKSGFHSLFSLLAATVLFAATGGSLRQLGREGAEQGKGRLVVRFLGDLRDLLGIGDIAGRVDNHYGPGEQACQGGAGYRDPVVLAEIRGAKTGQGDDILQAFNFTEALVGEGKIGGYTEDHSVDELACFLVEPPHRCRADGGVDAGEDVQNNGFSTIFLKRTVGKIGLGQGKTWGLVFEGGQGADGLNGVSLECYLSHGYVLSVKG